MQRPAFDIRGNLSAEEPIHLSITEVESSFVTPFGVDSNRSILFNEYRRYVMDLQSLLGCSFYQWLNGSFTTTCFSPSDIDLVSFIDHQVYLQKEQLIDERFSKWAVRQHY